MMKQPAITKLEEKDSGVKELSSIHEHSLSGARVRWGRAGIHAGSPHRPGSIFGNSSAGGRKFGVGQWVCLAFVLCIFSLLATPAGAQADMRVKDLVQVDGADDNELEGVGIVVGLSGTGDQSSPLRAEMLRNKINRFVPDLNIQESDIGTGNTALVSLSATLPAFQKANTEIDVAVSTIGDAESLRGGRLWGGYLRGPNKTVYAMAKGPVSLSGTHLTDGYIPEGGRVIREVPHNWVKEDTFIVGQNRNGQPIRQKKRYIQLNLDTPNWNATQQIADALNSTLPKRGRRWALKLQESVGNIAVAVDRSTIYVQVPTYTLSSSESPSSGATGSSSNGQVNANKQRSRGVQVNVSDVKILSDILEQPVEYIANSGFSLKKPKIIINEKATTWAIQGNVIVTPVTVPVAGVQGMQAVNIQQPRPLDEFLLNNQNFANLTDAQVIEIIKALNSADALNAKVVLR